MPAKSQCIRIAVFAVAYAAFGAASLQATPYGIAVTASASATHLSIDSDVYAQNNALTAKQVSAFATYDAGPFGIVSGSATSAADLATGQLKAFGTGSLNCLANGGCLNGGQGYASALFNDTLTFFIPGATPTTITPISLWFDSQGVISIAQTPHDVQHIFRGDFFTNGAPGFSFTGQYQYSQVATFAGGKYLASSTWISQAPDHFALKATYNLEGSRPVLTLRMGLYAVGSSGSTSDFSHTAGIRLATPAGVTWTSGSGVFLSEAPVDGVPEPSTWALLIIGFMSIGAALRGQRPLSRQQA